ncbi:hypothetical protein [Streptomyces cucumeris]|uniref:hypothetical protein n=1 Tax=Streptomyces cucumeris TaxID=2962890 RepID=UPI0020C8C4A5|nr:hypothetical protein [Streptomyces sp. NEAU-Y11]MCP9209505.1 hypothetical protein [Streptomyces sp. NEAU-Y11]
MAKNEVFKYGQWVSLPLPLRGNNPDVNADPTLPGDPVKVGSIVGFVQEVGGKPISYSVGSTTVTQTGNPANSLKPGWASVALAGAFAFPVTGWDAETKGSGTPVFLVAANGSNRATLTTSSNSDPFGVILGQTHDGVPIVNIVQPVPGDTNAVPDKAATGS